MKFESDNFPSIFHHLDSSFSLQHEAFPLTVFLAPNILVTLIFALHVHARLIDTSLHTAPQVWSLSLHSYLASFQFFCP